MGSAHRRINDRFTLPHACHHPQHLQWPLATYVYKDTISGRGIATVFLT